MHSASQCFTSALHLQPEGKLNGYVFIHMNIDPMQKKNTEPQMLRLGVVYLNCDSAE